MSPDLHESQLDRVAERWDATAEGRTQNPIQGWLDSPIVLEACVLPKLGGGHGYHWLQAAVDRHSIPKSGRWLSLGCGAAGTEIAAAGWGIFGSMLALDASPVSLEIARRTAAARGVTNIQFESMNLNRVELPRASFDVALMNMSLHHVEELRHVLSRVRRALRRDGFLLVNEFIGPRQFQFTELQLGLVRDLLALLPERLRKDSTTGQVKKEYVRMPLEHWAVADPSEAIRSDEILPEIARQFRLVERIDYGGTILNLLLEHIVHNFDPGSEEDVASLAALGRLEDTLIRNNAIPSDFVFAIAQRRGLFGRIRRAAGL